MDYHHRDPTKKEFELSRKMKRGSFESIKKEIDKCDLVCSNCHRNIHYELELLDYNENMSTILSRLEKLKESNGKPTPPIRKSLSAKYSKDEIEILIQEGKTIKEISESLGEQYNAVSSLIKKYKLHTLTNKRSRLDQKESIIRDYVTIGFSLSSLSEKYSMTESDMIETLKSYNIPIRISKKVFTPSDLENIKTLLGTKIKVSKISQIVGCHLCSLYRIMKKHNITR